MNSETQTTTMPDIDVSRSSDGDGVSGGIVIAVAAIIAGIYLYRKFFARKRSSGDACTGCASGTCPGVSLDDKQKAEQREA